MRILVLHNRYRSGDTSGENRVVHDEVAALRAAGHTVATWQPEPDVTSPLGLVRAAGDAIWARRAASDVHALVARERIDVVHGHNLFPSLSPAVLPAARDAGAAVVVTLHNYRYLCLPATLMRGGQACTDCVGKTPWPGIVHRCYRGSLAGSMSIGTALTVHRATGSFDAVDRFAAVSNFIKDTYEGAGFGRGRIVVKPNFAPPASRRRGPGDGFLYLGRLAREKGVDTLLRAWHGAAGRLGRLTVVGGGPAQRELEATAPPDVSFLGDVPGDRVQPLIGSTRAVLIPSRWEEAALPRVALEAYASEVPVIASRKGALPEGVIDKVTGLLVPAGDPDAWREALGTLLDDATSERLGAGAIERWRERYTPQGGVFALERLYRAAIERRRSVT